MRLREIKDKFDYFWLFDPIRDSWRLARLIGPQQFPAFSDGGLWVLQGKPSDDYEAIGIEMPRHPRSVLVPKEGKR
jgi:hypothetical protein